MSEGRMDGVRFSFDLNLTLLVKLGRLVFCYLGYSKLV